MHVVTVVTIQKGIANCDIELQFFWKMYAGNKKPLKREYEFTIAQPEGIPFDTIRSF